MTLMLTGFGTAGAVGGSAFPSILGSSFGDSGFNTTGATKTVTFDQAPAAGELLLVIIRISETTVSITDFQGFSQADLLASVDNGYVLYKVAAGTEGTSVGFVTDGVPSHGFNTYRIAGYQGAPEAAQAGLENPPSLTPTWGAGSKTLWLSMISFNRAERNILAPPANYNNLVKTDQWETVSSSSIRMGSANRKITAASEDPGTFTLDVAASNPHAATIAVRAAA